MCSPGSHGHFIAAVSGNLKRIKIQSTAKYRDPNILIGLWNHLQSDKKSFEKLFVVLGHNKWVFQSH